MAHGVWEGEQDVPRTGLVPVTVEFKEAQGQVRWHRTIQLPNGRVVKASGLAKVSGDSVEMEGTYDTEFVGHVSLSLNRKGDMLVGTGKGSSMVRFDISLRKVK